MIIRPRMPRILSRRSRTGILGLRSLQRSVVHVRRMIVSRLPEHAPEDIQSAIDQPLVWSDQQPLLTGPTEPVTLDAGQRRSTSTSFHQPNSPTQSRQSVQRSTSNASEPETMPRDLQAIFNLHREKGNVDGQSSFMDQIRDELVSQGKPPPTQSKRPGASSPPVATPVSPPAQAPVQRQLAGDDFPIVVEPPPPRRVRSRVEYVRPGEKTTPAVQKQSDQTTESSDDDPSLASATIEQPTDEVPLDLPDAIPERFGMDATEQAIARAEAPSSPPQVSLGRDADSDFADEPVDTYQAEPLDDDWDESTKANSLDIDPAEQAIARAEAPSSPPQVSMSRDADSDFADEPVDTYQAEPLDDDWDGPTNANSLDMEATEQAIARAEASSSPPQVSLSRDADSVFAHDDFTETSSDDTYDEPLESDRTETTRDNTIADAIARAESPSSPPQVSLSRDAEADFATILDIPTQTEIEPVTDQPSNIGQRPRKLTVSKATPPMQIQPLRIKTPGDEEDESFLDSTSNDSNVDDGGEDNATADMAPAEDETSADVVQMMRDDIDYYSAPEPDPLPEQSVDLGAALFGGSEFPPVQSQPTVQRQQDDGPLPTLMPPIGSTQAKASPQSFIQRDLDREAAVKAHIQRAEAPREDADMDDFRAPSAEESGLLSLLDMPADTPIQQSGGQSLPTIQASREHEIDVQRAVETGEVTSEVEGGDDNSDSESQSNQPSSEDVKNMANQVYSIIKRRLKIEQQRLGGRK